MKNQKRHRLEKTQVFRYLLDHVATATMVAVSLEIYRPNVCRYKSMLERAGKLRVVKRDRCKITGCMADYLTCEHEKEIGHG